MNNLQNLRTFNAGPFMNYVQKIENKIRNRTFYCIETDYAIGKLLKQNI